MDVLTPIQPKRPRCTPQLTDSIVAMIRQGATKEDAALAHGLSPERLSRWLAQSRTPYGAFRRKVLQAEAEARARAGQRVFEKDAITWVKTSLKNQRTVINVSPAGVEVDGQQIAVPVRQLVDRLCDRIPDMAEKIREVAADFISPGRHAGTAALGL